MTVVHPDIELLQRAWCDGQVGIIREVVDDLATLGASQLVKAKSTSLKALKVHSASSSLRRMLP